MRLNKNVFNRKRESHQVPPHVDDWHVYSQMSRLSGVKSPGTKYAL